MQFFKHPVFLGFAVLLASACNEGTVKSDESNKDRKDTITVQTAVLDYELDSVKMHGFSAFNAPDSGARPVVIVVPEWWGLTEYPKMRATELAKLGYLAVVADFYGNAAVAANPDEAKKFATPFYENPLLAKARFDALVAAVAKLPMADTSRMAAIGYCFGGAQVLNLARLGEPLKAVVSFHGDLLGVAPDKAKLKAAVLVCHGASDSFVGQNQVDLFKKQMDSIAANYVFKTYAGATHSFTNPEATAIGKKFNMPVEYNAAADTASWNDMKSFLKTALH